MVRVSVARLSADVDTSNGCTTSRAIMSEMMFFRTLMPWYFLPLACRLRSSVTIWIGLSPAFSASVYGMISSASANARTHHWSRPASVLAHALSLRLSCISGAPPPAISARFCIRHRMTHNASCRDRSASSSTNLLLPRSNTLAVCPGLATPVIFTTLPLPTLAVSTRAAEPSFSGFMWSTCEIGRHPSDLLMCSISSRSMFCTTMIFALAR